MDDEHRERARNAAAELLGFPELRPGQEDAIAAALAGRDVLAVLPTGSGKSAIYQVAGACIEGSTLVVSPLIALQHDQVERIGDELGGGAVVNSTVGRRHRDATFDAAADGRLEFVFLAPEQLANPETRAELAAAPPSLVVVDEAHCISTWGHDFRPEYRQLAEVIERLGRPQVMALTATAAPPVRRDIVEQLRLEDPAVVVAGFERPNLHLQVRTVRDDGAVDDAVVEHVHRLGGTGLVYVATRADAERIAAALSTDARPALAYHAGLSSSERQEVHDRFRDEAPCVVAATTAFGMGIDVAHVRFVVHAEPPESLDAYLQEVGRAGRDGQPAAGILVYPLEGGTGRRFFAGIGAIPPVEVQQVAEAVAACPDAIELPALEQVTELTDTRLGQVLNLLQELDAVEVDGERVRWTGSEPVAATAEAAAELRERDREVERTRRTMVDRYLDSDGCRWQLLLSYFGEAREAGCGHCDRCDEGGVVIEDDTDRPFPLGARVRHDSFGAGDVVRYNADTVTVLFDEAGYRTLALELVEERGLLDAV